MVRNPPNHILNQIAAGKFRLTPAHLAPRKVGPTTTLPPLFPPARVEALRQRLLRAGIDPVRVGGLPPPVAPSTAISVPSSATYKAACREIKYAHGARSPGGPPSATKRC